MNISSEVNTIIEQAPEWNFAGDCALLELMKRISENLKERGEHTSQKLREFETSVWTTDIALNNATNSLRSLQFGQQFVEYRIEEVDDDDFAIPETREKKPLPPEIGPKEMSKEFLQNNLNMLRKNFEPVTLEVPDSDEDEDVEGAKEQTTLYRPKNPYDAIPLPYIIGSKEWQKHKYAGLYESRENSEDEQSEEFSSSSSDEKDELRKTDTNISQSDSSPVAPLRRDPAIVKVKQTIQSPQKSAPEQAPRTQPRPIISSQTKQQLHEHDLFAALRQSPPSDDAPSTSSSMRSSPAFAHLPATDGGPSLSSSSSSPAIQPPPPKVFEKEELPKTVPTELHKEVVSKPSNPIKRMPVNLFNDDEFNSFMTEIVDKAQGKTTTEIEKKPVKESPKKDLEQQKPQTPKNEVKGRTMNLFDDSPPPSPAFRQPSLKTTPDATPATSTVKPLPKSLFDDDLDDFDDDFLSSLTAKAKAKTKPIEQISNRTSLFDDDDELDIDDIFTKKPLPTAKAKSTLFEPETTPPSPPVVAMKKSLFDDIEDDEDIFGTPKTMKPLPKTEIEPPETEEYHEKKPIEIVSEGKPTEVISDVKSLAKSINVTDLFNDDFSDDEINTVFETNPPKIQTTNKEAEDKQHDKSIEKDGDDQKELFKDVHNFSNISKNAFTVPPIDCKSNDLIKKSIENLDQDSSDNFAVPPVDSEKPQIDPTTGAISDTDDDSVKGELFTKVPIDSMPILSDSPPPDIPDDRKEEDPIISMIAEVTSNRQNRGNSPSYEPAQVAAAQTIMQNYSSLFDEPPDDTEFFSNLTNSNLSSLSASKIFDIQDQDFFEPALPKIPSATKPTSATSNTGIFSDVPPDDDADNDENVDDNFVPTTTASVDVHGNTKRIHTIFYDDFSETARAASTVGAGTPNLPIVNEEPMPQADEVDRHVQVDPTISPVKKLVMPNININVQTLMPGLGPKLTKKIEMPKEKMPDPARTDNSLQHVNKTRVRGPAQRRPSTRRGRKENYAKTLQDEESQQVEKTKEEPTKVPVKVKPNFLDSDDDDDDPLFGSVRPTTTEVPKEIPKISSVPAPHLITKESEVKKSVPFIKTPSKLFNDSDDDDVDLTKASHRINKESEVKKSATPVKSQSKLFDDSDDDDVTPTPQLVSKKVVQKNTAAPVKTRNTLFDDSDDDDDDLFASAVPAPAATKPVVVKSTATAKVTPHAKNVTIKTSKSLFSDDEDDDDDLFGIKSAKPTAHKVVKPNVAATVIPSSSSSGKSIPLSTDNPLSDLLDFE